MERKKRTVNKWKKLLQLSLLYLGLMGFTFGVRAADAGVYLTEAEGSVSIKTGSGRSLQRSEGEKLDSGNRILTEEDGRAKLGVGDSGELLLEAGGVLEYRSMGSRKEFLLENGILFFDWKEEGGAFSIRTSTTAFTAYSAKGWVRIVDRYHTLLCLEEGEITCSVTDPVSGQVKSTSLMEKNVAECVVYPKEENGERCDILLRELAEEEREETIQTAKAAGTALGQEFSHINNINNAEKAETQPEQSQTAELRDPVWGGEVELADASSNEEGADALEDEDDPLDEGNAVQYFPGIVLPPSMPYTPLSGGIFKEEMQVADSDSSHSSEPASNPSASAPPAGSEPSSPENPSDSVGPTKNQGLIGGALENYGTILVEEDGKLSLKNNEGEIQRLVNRNEHEEGKGIIINKGVIEANIENYHTSSFTMESGSVTSLNNVGGKEVKIRISGGTVEEGVQLSDGIFEMTGGTVKAAKGEDTGAITFWDNGNFKITGGTILNENGGPAIRLAGGKVELSDSVVVKAKEPLKLLTVTGVDFSGPAEISYVSGGKVYTKKITDGDYLDLYVTRQGADGLTTLSGLGGSFSDAVEAINAGRGDRITLGKDVSEMSLNAAIEARGGSGSAPVVLDLNGNILRIAKQQPAQNSLSFQNTIDTQDDKDTIRFCNAVWKIENGSLSISDDDTDGYMSIDEQSNVTLSGVTMKNTETEVIYNYGNCALLDVLTGDIHNRGGGTCTAKGKIECQGVITNDEGTFKIQNASVMMGDYDYCIENAINDKPSTFSISDSKISVGALENYKSGTFKMTNSTIESLYDFYNAEEAQFLISDCTFTKIDSAIFNDGKLEMTNSKIEALSSLDNGGESLISNCNINFSYMFRNRDDKGRKSPVCRLIDSTVRCISAPSDAHDGLINENADLYIKGGSILCEQGNRSIKFNPSTQGRDQTIEIEGVEFPTQDTWIEISSIGENGSPAFAGYGSRTIIIRNTNIDGGDSSAILGDGLSKEEKIKLIVEEGARLSSRCEKGTIWLRDDGKDEDGDVALEVHLNGGSIVNESEQQTGEGSQRECNYAAIFIDGYKAKDTRQRFMIEGIGTEVRVKGDRSPLLYYEHGGNVYSDIEGYKTELREDGYTYLVSGTNTVFLSVLPDQTENESLEHPSAEMSDDEASKPETPEKKDEDQEEGKEQEKEDGSEEPDSASTEPEEVQGDL